MTLTTEPLQTEFHLQQLCPVFQLQGSVSTVHLFQLFICLVKNTQSVGEYKNIFDESVKCFISASQ